MLSALHVGVRLFHLLQRVDAVDQRFDLAILQQRKNMRQNFFNHHRFLCKCLGAQCGPGHGDAFHQQRREIHFGLETPHVRDVDDAAFRCGEVQVFLYIVAPDHIENDIYLVIESQLGEDGFKVIGLVVNRTGSAVRL